MLCPDELIQEAIEAHKNGEVREEPEVNTVEFIMERSQEVLFRVHKKKSQNCKKKNTLKVHLR